MLKVSDQVNTFRHLCNSKLQLQSIVMQPFGICSTKVARQQLRCFQSNLSALFGRDRCTVQPRSALEVGYIADAMRKCFECSKPVIEIKGRTPLKIKLA
ncbi:hypothetical protein KR52_01530 [Synechococcus sp. KORDI-52]|nr:hypothetical protein KR52_01530 [Synechococcus sp. KORDI-52]